MQLSNLLFTPGRVKHVHTRLLLTHTHVGGIFLLYLRVLSTRVSSIVFERVLLHVHKFTFLLQHPSAESSVIIIFAKLSGCLVSTSWLLRSKLDDGCGKGCREFMGKGELKVLVNLGFVLGLNWIKNITRDYFKYEMNGLVVIET